jgi:hypothetical protein
MEKEFGTWRHVVGLLYNLDASQLCSFKGTLFSFTILLALAGVKRVHIYAGFGDKFLGCFLTNVKMPGGYRLLFSDGQKFSCFVGCNPSKLLGSFP